MIHPTPKVDQQQTDTCTVLLWVRVKIRASKNRQACVWVRVTSGHCATITGRMARKSVGRRAVDEAVQADPASAYEPEFFQALSKTWVSNDADVTLSQNATPVWLT